MSRAVVFDIGAVLVEWDPTRHYDAVYGRAHREAFFAAVDVYAMNAELDMGADFAETVARWGAAHPDWARELTDWHAHWVTSIGPAIDGSVALLRRLRAAGVPVFALSNFGAWSFGEAEALFPFLKDFDARFVSGRLGMMKPDPAIYAHVERETGLSGDRLFFTDDSVANIAAAEARGWAVHLFEGPEGLEDRLTREGFL